MENFCPARIIIPVYENIFRETAGEIFLWPKKRMDHKRKRIPLRAFEFFTDNSLLLNCNFTCPLDKTDRNQESE